MKKTLVALAALASMSAFAQSTVTISGNVDAGIRIRDTQDNNNDHTRVQANNSSTTALFFRGTEDLGGGMRANFSAEINWNPTQSQTVNGNAGSNYYVGTPFNGEQFIGLQGGFGNLRIGSPNASMLETNGKAQPFGTAIGSTYMNTGVNRLGSSAYGISQYVGGVEAIGRVIRHERTVRYDTPNMNGFGASYEWSGKNSNHTTANQENQNGYTSLGLTYSKGPLNLAYSSAEAQAGANVAAGGTTAGAVVAGPLPANAKLKYTFLAANYTMGATTVYYGATTGKSTGLASAATFDASSSNVAVRHAVSGNLAVMANVTRVNNKLGATDPKSTGLGADYSLSKRTTAYVRYEKFDTDTGSATAGNGKMTAVGFRHTF